MLDAYFKKFGDSGASYVVRSLVYFDEADADLAPKCFFDYDWDKIKTRLRNEVKKL